MKIYSLVAFVCVAWFSGAESRSLNATHVDIPPEIVYATRVFSSDNNNSTTTTTTNSGVVYSKTKNTRVKASSTEFNRTLPEERQSKSLISGQQSKFYLDLPVHVPNNSDHYHNINIDAYNPFRDDKYGRGENSTSYVLEPKHMSNQFYHKTQSGYPSNNFPSPYRKTTPVTSLSESPSVELTHETSPPPVRFNTKYPSLQYVPDTSEFDAGPGPGPYPHITYTYPYVMDKQMQILHTFKSLSESLFHMIYEIYFCMRYYWNQGVMKCMTGKSSLFGEDRMFYSGEGSVDEDLKEESRIFTEDLTPVTDPLASEEEDDEVLHGEPRGLGAEDRGTPGDTLSEGKSVGEERKGQQGYGGGGGAVSAFSSGLGTGIGNGVSHQVFTYQQPKKKKKKKKKGSSGGHHSSHHHSMKHMLPYFVAAKAKLLSVLMIVGFLAKKAWIVSSISLMLSLLGLFAKLASKGNHRSTEVILAKPTVKDWDWDKDWNRIADEPEERVKPSTYRLVPVEDPTPIPLHYFEKDKDDNKDFYM